MSTVLRTVDLSEEITVILYDNGDLVLEVLLDDEPAAVLLTAAEVTLKRELLATSPAQSE